MCEPTRRRGLEPWPTIVRNGSPPSRARGIAAVVAAVVGLIAAPAAAITVTVPDDWPTIQQAIDSEADEVLVRPGTYPETLVVARQIHIRGLVPTGTPLDSLPTVAGMLFQNHELEPNGQTNYIKIWDLRVSGPVRNLFVTNMSLYKVEISRCALDAGLSDEGSTSRQWLEYSIQSCRIDGPTRLGFPKGVLIELCLVRQPILLDQMEWASLVGNHINGSGAEGVSAEGWRSKLEVRGNTFEGYERPLRSRCWVSKITDNRFIGPGLVAVESVWADWIEITGNHITGFDVGIQCSFREYQLELAGNKIEDCRIAAVQASTSTDSRFGGWILCVANEIRSCGVGLDLFGSMAVRGNIVRSCAGDGISIRGRYLTLESNVVGRCGGAGIRVENHLEDDGDDSPRFSRNTSYENGGSGYVIFVDTRDSLGHFDRNIGHGNARFGLELSGRDSLSVGCNDWFGNGLGAVQGIALSPSDLTVDPLFCDVTLGDVHLSERSPLLDVAGCGTIGALEAGCPAPGAVKLLGFSASPKTSSVELRWSVGDAAPGFLAWLERADREAGPWALAECERSTEGDMTVDLDRAIEPGRRYWYRLLVTDRGTTRVLGAPLEVVAPLERFALVSRGPNPAAGAIDVEFRLPHAAEISLDVFDPQGRRVATLASGAWSPGSHRATWAAASRAAPGLYLVRFRYPGGQAQCRVVLVR